MIRFLDTINYHKVIKYLVFAVYAAGFLGMSLFSFEFGNIHIFPYRIFIPLIWLILIFRVCINKGTLNIPPVKVKKFGIFMLVWLIYAILSVIWAIDKTSAFKHVIFLVISFSMIVFTVVFIDTIEDLQIISVIWLVFLGLAIIIGISETVIGIHLPVSRFYERVNEYYKYTPTALFYNPNDFATFLSLSVPFLLSYFFFSKKFIYRLLFFLSFIASLYVLYATRSRANFLALFLEIGYFTIVFFSLQVNRKEIYYILAGSLSVLLVIPKRILEIFSAVQHNLQSIVTQASSQVGSMGERMNLAVNGLMFLLSTWGFGVGAGNVEYWMMSKAQFETGNKVNIHNWFLEVLVNYGIFIFTGYLIFYGGIIYNVYKQMRIHQDDHKMKVIGVAILGSMLGFLFASISSSSIMAFRPHWMMYAIGLTYINIGLNKAPRNELNT